MTSRRLVALAVVAASVSVPAGGRAGARPYAYTQGTEAVPEGEAELESWVGAERLRGEGRFPGAHWWLGPVVGLSERFETGVFVIASQPPGRSEASRDLSLSALRPQITYAPLLAGEGPVALRLRGELTIPIGLNERGTEEEAPTLWGEAILGTDLGPLNITANAGLWLKLEREVKGDEVEHEPEPYYVYALAASVEISSGLRLGVEAHGTGAFVKDTVSSVGPSLALARGRLWLALNAGVGIVEPDSPKLDGRLVLGLVL